MDWSNNSAINPWSPSWKYSFGPILAEGWLVHEATTPNYWITTRWASKSLEYTFYDLSRSVEWSTGKNSTCRSIVPKIPCRYIFFLSNTCRCYVKGRKSPARIICPQFGNWGALVFDGECRNFFGLTLEVSSKKRVFVIWDLTPSFFCGLKRHITNTYRDIWATPNGYYYGTTLCR